MLARTTLLFVLVLAAVSGTLASVSPLALSDQPAALAAPDRADLARAHAAALYRRQASASATAGAQNSLGGSLGTNGVVYATGAGNSGEPVACLSSCTTWDSLYTGCMNNDTASCFGICTPYNWNQVVDCFSCTAKANGLNATGIDNVKASLTNLAKSCADAGSPVGSIASLTLSSTTTNLFSGLTVATPTPATPTSGHSSSSSTNGAVGPGGGIPIAPASTSGGGGNGNAQPPASSKPASSGAAAEDALSLAAVFVVVLASTLVTL
ncbi:uncharacterized protein LOC62_02G003131 [Vanrija pseudolonga]|uniref:Extracellular membrane protein CFEM domain-containing protein n=1 Tax=Vanrija pseudolonga TaxID=143232 RepID=A0AAF1BKG9_9TREE|nr:hypothetical protein LOC62_02G003131 [Vanrija pseudolonga]